MRNNLNLDYQLNDNISAESGRIFLTGTQALLRMLLSQARRDQAAGLNTAGFISGYRGSPLGGVDSTMWRHAKELEQARIRFQPAINEDLAATMMMGTQQLDTHPNKEVDGVFGMWYGKGPGVDRACDALHHGHAAGASHKGGVLVVVGDDHVGVSSSIPHSSEHALRHLRMPIIHPSSVEEYEYFGLWGWALSRYSGAWVGFKAITETVESGRAFTIIDVPQFDLAFTPSVHARSYDAKPFLTPNIENNIESRLVAVREFARAYPLDKMIDPAPTAKIGIVTTGKSTVDTLEALENVQKKQALPELRHYKLGLIWPIETEGFLAFARDLDYVLVIEEKDDFIEAQIKTLLFDAGLNTRVQGKKNSQQHDLISRYGQLSPSSIEQALLSWLGELNLLPSSSPASSCTLPTVKALDSFGLSRRPYFCSGCPHNSSTKVPDGSKALAGVGCHYMASWMDRDTQGLTQMGGEGTDWVGASAFMNHAHIFQNMGEGTYFHSGYLAIRQAVAAGANITYKILFNDAVAMTGGQPVDGPISVPRICQQVLGEGVKKVVITTDEPERYKGVSLPSGIEVLHRRELDRVQRELRDISGVTVLIHDQTCAAEKRRRRKKNDFPNPQRRIFINPEVCEGCGDCGVQSNCLSIVPLETELGRKRAIDQSSCNKDFSCVEGFCPSFVSVLGAEPKKAAGLDSATLQKHFTEALHNTVRSQGAPTACNLIVAGIGGTGVITIGAIVAMAAHLENRGSSVLDMTGLAQKGGTVISHVRLSADHHSAGTVRIDTHQADVAILCDSVAASNAAAAQCIAPQKTQVFINEYLAPTSEFTRQPDIKLPRAALVEQLVDTSGQQNSHHVDAHYLAEQLFGDSILSNMMMLGMAWQQGAIPISLTALQRAIELNGVAIAANQLAFDAGRVWIAAPEKITALIAQHQRPTTRRPQSLQAALEVYVPRLTAYQNAAYAKRFTQTIQKLSQAEQRVHPGSEQLSLEAAHSLYKLMAYKDEYEVARLYSEPAFMEQLQQQFEAGFDVNFHMAPPWISRLGSHGRPLKRQLGGWMLKFMPRLAQAKALRGTAFDLFGYQAERKMERELRDQFMQHLCFLSTHLTAEQYDLALQYVQIPQRIRGFGPVKHTAVDQARNDQAQLIAQGLVLN